MKSRDTHNEYLGYRAWILIENIRSRAHELNIDQQVYDHMMHLNYIDDLVIDLETYVFEEITDEE